MLIFACLKKKSKDVILCDFWLPGLRNTFKIGKTD